MKTKPLGAIDIIVAPTLNKTKAIYWFLKNMNKLNFDRMDLHIRINTILIKKNPNYKIWNPRKPFKGKNPKYICFGFDQKLMNLNFRHDLNYN